MVVQNPTLLEGSVTGILQGTASFALTASYANNITNQETLMWYGRVPALTTGINIYLNSSSVATLPYDNNSIYVLTPKIVGLNVSGVRDIYDSAGNAIPIVVYRSGSTVSNADEIYNIYNNNGGFNLQLNSGSGGSSTSLVISGSKDAYNKLKFTVESNLFTQTVDIYVTLRTLQVINQQALPSTI